MEELINISKNLETSATELMVLSVKLEAMIKKEKTDNDIEELKKLTDLVNEKTANLKVLVKNVQEKTKLLKTMR